MAQTSVPTTATAGEGHGGAAAFAPLLSAAAGLAAAKLERTFAGWTDKLQKVGGNDPSGALVGLADKGLDELEQDSGAATTAGVEAVEAGLHGDNPVWAGLKGAWHSGTPALRAAMISAAVAALLLLVLSPVLLVVFLLALLVLAAFRGSRRPAEART